MIIGVDASRVNISHRTGTENYTYNVIYHLARLGGSGELGRLGGSGGEVNFRLYFREKPDAAFWRELTGDNPLFHYKVIPWPRLWTQGGLALELLVHPVDVVFIAAHTMPVIRRPGQKFVVTIHGLEYMYMPEYEKFPHKLYLTKSTEFVSRFADRIVAVSEFTKKSLLEHGWGATEERITVIPEGVRTDHFSPQSEGNVQDVLQKYNITQPYFFFISTIQPRKNVLGLVEAFALLREEIAGLDSHPELDSGSSLTTSGFQVKPGMTGLSDVQLVIAGGHGYKFEEVKAAIRRFGLEDMIKVLGRVPDEDVPALFSGAVASVYPSFVEGFGLPVLESMACGTPVVCADTGALPEVGGDAAVYVDPYDVESISQGLQNVLADEGLRTQLIEKGLDRVKQFRWEHTAQELYRIFESLHQ